MLKFQDDYITKNENMEDVFTIILAIVDDLHQTYAPDEIRNRKNIAEARCSDAEIITISIVGEMMGVDYETTWTFLREKESVPADGAAACKAREGDGCRNMRELHHGQLSSSCLQVRESVFLQEFPMGRGGLRQMAIQKETYYGYKVHVLTPIDGYISRYVIGKANEDDREGLYHLTDGLYGITIFGDKGYSVRAIREAMAEQGITLLALKPSHHKDHQCKISLH